MGLFLGPFSGHAVGGGGHGVIDPPPPGADPEMGPRSEVDTVNRTPLRLLKTTMNKHKPRFMKIVPPGQQRGTIAPPYSWEPRERDDWQYKLNKPSLKEGEFDAPGHPSPPGPATAQKPQDPRHARVDAIRAELKQLHQEIRDLLARQKQLVQKGKQQVAATAKQFAPKVESLVRMRLRLLEADYTPLGIHRREGDPPRPGWHIDPHESPLPMPTPPERREIAKMRNLRSRGIPTGLRNQPPKASFELIAFHKQFENQLAQKRARIKQLTQELKQLRQQMQMSHESTGLRSNNLHRQGLLLK